MVTKKSTRTNKAGVEPGTADLEEGPQDMSDVGVALNRALRDICSELRDVKLFPGGITKIDIEVKLAGSTGATLSIQGPDSGPKSRQELLGEDMEWITPPDSPVPGKGHPKRATAVESSSLKISVAKSISGAASLYTGSCEGGDTYQNNCAHYLSDAFVRAGYTELNPPCGCVNARCSTASKRPLRARDMWCWFKSMATDSREKLPQKEGLWAVFQLNEKEYWGGHVVIIDTDNNNYYGTGNYPNWDQHCYKW